MPLEHEFLLAGRDDLAAYAVAQYPWYDVARHHRVIIDHLEALERGEFMKLAIFTPPQHSKPVSVEMPVLKADGSSVPLANIHVGDEVIAHSGLPRYVNAVYDQGVIPVVRIRTLQGRQIIAAPDHPFLTAEGWKRADRIRASNYERPGRFNPADGLAVLHSVEVPDTSGQTIEAFRMAGYFVGDGCLTQNNCNWTNGDPGVIEEFRRCVYLMGGNTIDRYNSPNSRQLGVSGLRPWFRTIGLAGHNAATKFVPEFVFRGSREKIAAFVAAYFECDGGLSRKGLDRNGVMRRDYTVEFISISRRLLEGVQHLLLRLGVPSLLARKDYSYKNERRIGWRLTITREIDIARFAAAIPLKGEKATRIKEWRPAISDFPAYYYADPVVAVEQAGEAECRCLDVERDHTFLANDVVVHNTSTASELFPAWYLGRHPDARVIVVSYGQDRADDFGEHIRYLLSTDYHKAIFPDCRLSPTTKSKNDFELIPVFGKPAGACRAAGREASITGLPADCLTAGTLIATELGDFPIEDLVRLPKRPRVLTYNHYSDTLEFKEIEAARELVTDREIVELASAGGRKLRCTSDHRIYLHQSGYRAASVCEPGGQLFTVKTKQALRELQAAQAWGGRVLSAMLSGNPCSAGYAGLRSLRSIVRETALRVRESVSPGLWPPVFLFPRLHDRQPEGGIDLGPPVHGLQGTSYATLREAVRCLQGFSRGATAAGAVQGLRILSAAIRANWPEAAVLFDGLRGSGAFCADAGQGQLAFSSWSQLQPGVRAATAVDCGARPWGLRALWTSAALQWKTLSDSPYRHQLPQQSADQSGRAVPNLSCGFASLRTSAVVGVRRIRGGGERVYDLQVAGNRNFFANGILVHNCIILDDLQKDETEARSEAVQIQLRSLMNTVIDARMHPKTRLLFIMTRWDPNDIAGWELDNHPDGWKVLALPNLGHWIEDMDEARRAALKAEERALLRLPDSQNGTALWPERYPTDWVKKNKRDRLLPSQWMALHQQIPNVGGETQTFNIAWHKTVSAAQLQDHDWLRHLKLYMVVDPANAKHKKSDYTVMLVVGLAIDRNWYVIDGIRDRLNQAERCDAAFDMIRKWNPLSRVRCVGWEQYGLQTDLEYIGDKMKKRNYRFRIEALGGNVRKEDRINGLTGLYFDGQIHWVDNIPCVTSGERRNLTDDFYRLEFSKYPAVAHDDMLDCLARMRDMLALGFANFPTPVTKSDAAFFESRRRIRQGVSFWAR